MGNRAATKARQVPGHPSVAVLTPAPDVSGFVADWNGKANKAVRDEMAADFGTDMESRLTEKLSEKYGLSQAVAESVAKQLVATMLTITRDAYLHGQDKKRIAHLEQKLKDSGIR